MAFFKDLKVGDKLQLNKDGKLMECTVIDVRAITMEDKDMIDVGIELPGGAVTTRFGESDDEVTYEVGDE